MTRAHNLLLMAGVSPQTDHRKKGGIYRVRKLSVKSGLLSGFLENRKQKFLIS